MIRVRCACGTNGNVKDKYAGRKIRCRRCGVQLRVPSAPARALTETAPLPTLRAAGLALPAPISRQAPAQPAPAADLDRFLLEPPKTSGRVDRDALEVAPTEILPEERRRNAIVDPRRRGRRTRRPSSRRPAGRSAPSSSRDLDYERHVVAIGIWIRILAVFVVALTTVGVLVTLLQLSAVTAMAPDAAVGTTAAAGIVFIIFGAIVALAAGIYAVGHGVARYREWARPLAAAALGAYAAYLAGVAWELPSALVILDVALSLVWLVPATILLIGGTIFDARYQAVVAETPHERVRWASSPFFWGPFVILAIQLVAGVIGFVWAVRSGLQTFGG